MKASFAVAALFGVFLCGCNNSSSPTGPSPARPGDLFVRAIPFNGSFEGTQTLTPPNSVNGSGTGTATQLGRFTVAFPHTVDFATRTGTGTYTFTAANGDTLTASFNGQAQGGPIVSIVEQATVTGGTGRFEGATGSFTVQRQFNPASGTTEGSFEGTISSVGASLNPPHQ